MLEYHYINKPIHLVSIKTISRKLSGMIATDLLEMTLINTETGGLIELKQILDNLINTKGNQYSDENFKIYLKEVSHYKGKPKGILSFFPSSKEGGEKTEIEFYLIISNPLWVPIIVKSIIVETPKFSEVEPNFKNIWTVPLNDLSDVIIKHIYKRIVDKNCLDNDMMLVQNIDWKIGKLTDLLK